MRKWLAMVDNWIDEESLEIVKLGMRAELNQDLRDGVKRPSDLVNALTVHYTIPIAVSRIIYSLEILGHRRYGYRSIRYLQQHLNQKVKPFDPSSDLRAGVHPQKFCLHQCLAVACQILPEEHKGSFAKHFGKKLSINPKTMKTPCNVITRLLERDEVDFENHIDVIEEAFIKSKLSESKIKRYHDMGK